MSSELLSQEHFAPHLGRAFRIEVQGGTVELKLTEVTALPPPRRKNAVTGELIPLGDPAVRAEPFSLLFVGPADRLLPQATYRMTPDSSEQAVDVFLVPIKRDRDGFSYEAVFG
jgi:hypothetical protein